MQHLPIERLAELGDVEPSRDEADHLAQCAQCARERAAYRRLAGLAGGERSRIGPPLTEWDALRERLADDGLIMRDAGRYRASALGGSRRWLRAAAAVMLVGGGHFAGRSLGGRGRRRNWQPRPFIAHLGHADEEGSSPRRGTRQARFGREVLAGWSAVCLGQ